MRAGGTERTNAAGIGTGSAQRTQPPSSVLHGGQMVHMGIIKQQVNGPLSSASSTFSSERMQYAESDKMSVLSSGTMKSYDATPQAVGVLTSSGATSIDLSGAGWGGSMYSRSPSVLTTAADVHVAPRGIDLDDASDNASHISSTSTSCQTDREFESTGVQTNGHGSNVIATETEEKIQAYGSQMSGHSSSIGVGGGEDINSLGMNTGGGTGTGTHVSEYAQSGGGETNSAHIRSTHITENGHGGSGSSVDSIYASSIEPIYASISPQGSKTGSNQKISRGSSQGSTSPKSPRRASVAAADGMTKGLSTSGGGGSEVDGRSGCDGGDNEVWQDNAADGNSFRFLGWEINEEDDEELPCQRVLVMKEVDLVLMMTVSIQRISYI